MGHQSSSLPFWAFVCKLKELRGLKGTAAQKNGSMKRNCRIKITEKPKAPFFCSEVDRQCQVSNSGNKRGTGKLRAGLADPGRHTELAFEKSGTICCHGNRRKSMSPDRWETDNWAERRQEVHRKWKSDSGFLAVWFWSPPVRWNRGFFPAVCRERSGWRRWRRVSVMAKSSKCFPHVRNQRPHF